MMRVGRAVTASLLMAACALGIAAGARAQAPTEPFKVRAYLDQDVYHPGQTAKIAVQLKIERPLHVNGAAPKDEMAIPTSVTWTSVPEGLDLGELSWPKPAKKAFPFTEGKKIQVYEGRVLARAEVEIGKSLPTGPLKLEGELRAQACDHHRCYRPETVAFKATVRLVSQDEVTAAINDSKFETRR